MDLTRLTLGALLFVTATAFIIRAHLIFFRILDEVNANRAASQQISFRFAGVMSEHAKLFPMDGKRRRIKVCLWVGFALLLLFALVFAVGNY